MSEVKKIATRASYGSALVELGKEHDDLVVLDADLAAATQTGMFKKEFPDRHIDCGIAECNMVGIGAGLANRKGTFCQHICNVRSRTCLRTASQLCCISASECKGWRNSWRYFRW